MEVYIRSTGNISPQHSLQKKLFFQEKIAPAGTVFKAVETDYSVFIDTKMIRRMSRIVKMGVAAALTCLREAGVESPEAIITASAYGCLEDTAVFLRRMIEFKETLLSPTAFIQSTHNTVGAQIALLLQSNTYNNTIVHRAFSFENALTEMSLLLNEGSGPVLVGAVDEITDDRQAILSRFGLYKQTRIDSKTVSGNVAGEGAAFFLFDKEKGNHSLAILKDVRTLYGNITAEQAIINFLKANHLKPAEVDLVLTAHTGDVQRDEPDDLLLKSVFRDLQCFPYKSLCGDYPTASSFALWFASILLNEQKSPEWMTGIQFPLKNILIHNHSENKHHSFILATAC